MGTEAFASTAHLTGIAPQFLVDDLNQAIAYYCAKLGFNLDFCYESFYASVSHNGCAIHLKCAPKTVSDRTHRKLREHLDAHITVSAVGALHDELQSRGALITRPPEERPWSCIEFYVEDLDGYILCFSEPMGKEVDRAPEVRSGAVLYAKDLDRIAAFYSAVVGLKEASRAKDHIVLESPAFQLVVLQTPGDIASQIDVTVPPQRRSMAAIKLVFFVPSLTKVRTSAAALGGVLNSSDKEWSFQGMIVCDGLDPEGNVIQFREQAR